MQNAAALRLENERDAKIITRNFIARLKVEEFMFKSVITEKDLHTNSLNNFQHNLSRKPF